MNRRPPTRRLIGGLLAAALVLIGSTPSIPASPAPLTKTVSASSQLGEYPATNASDGNQNTYWESANSQFPQWL